MLGSASAVGEVNAGRLVSPVREVNPGPADELFSSIDVAPGLVSAVAEMNAGCGSGVITELGAISGISYRFVSPVLLSERALIIITTTTTTTTHMITITVMETVAMVAVVMVFIVGIMVLAVVVLVVVAAVVVIAAVLVVVDAVVADVMVLSVVVVAAVVAIAAVLVHAVGDIDPGEPVNMLSFFAFECTQETPQSI